jgi:hypothetical protein
MLDRLFPHPLTRGRTEVTAALAIYVAATLLAYVFVGQVAKLAASGA